jgi:hypothetical protein
MAFLLSIRLPILPQAGKANARPRYVKTSGLFNFMVWLALAALGCWAGILVTMLRLRTTPRWDLLHSPPSSTHSREVSLKAMAGLWLSLVMTPLSHVTLAA